MMLWVQTKGEPGHWVYSDVHDALRGIAVAHIFRRRNGEWGWRARHRGGELWCHDVEPSRVTAQVAAMECLHDPRAERDQSKLLEAVRGLRVAFDRFTADQQHRRPGREDYGALYELLDRYLNAILKEHG